MNKNLSTLSTLYISALLVFSGNATADISLGNAFLYGDNIEVGIGSDGAFGSERKSTTGKSSGSYLGYISDPTGNRFQASYHGDFFLPGKPEEGWAVSFDGKTYNNNRNQQGAEVFGDFSNFKSTTYSQKVTWKGTKDGLEITQVYRVYTEGMAVVFDITLKNTTSTVMNNVYYMRTVDPDNNAEQNPENGSSRFVTTNTILSQGSDGDGISAVSATQEAKPNYFTKSSLTLSGYGANSRVTYGGSGDDSTINRNPSDVYNGTSSLHQSGTNTADEAVSLAFKFDKLEPGDTVTFRAGYQLKEVPVPSIDIDENDSSGESGKGFKQLYILGSTASNITDTDISITGDGFNQLQQAIITLTNPHDGDRLEILGELPAGIIIDTDESTDTEIRLKGLASKEDYQTVLKQAMFSNSNTDSRIDTRIISIQLVDENSTLSNAALSIICITIPVVINGPIAEDDVINEGEVANVMLTGHAAPNASIKIDFIDKDGKKLEPAKTVTADENGQWTLEGSPADLSSLSDGKIEVLVTAIDQNENEATQTKEVIKDTTILLTDIKPVDAELVSSFAPTYEGKTDPNASITLKIMPNGKVYTTTADAEGHWSVPLDKFPLGVTVSTEITAEDEHGNQTSSTQSFKTPNLPIEITDLDVNVTGIANSTTPTIKGTSLPGTDIALEMLVENAQSISCHTSTNNEGEWSCQLPDSPSGGPYTLRVTTTDDKNNSNSITKELSIPELPLVVDSPINDAIISGVKPIVSGTSKPGTHITVTVSDGKQCTAVTDATNHWSCELPSLALDQDYSLSIVSTDSVGNSVTKSIDVSTEKLPLSVITPKDNSTTEDTTPTFVGTSTPGTTVKVKVATGQECTAIADSEGKWRCELPVLSVGGPYLVTINAVDKDGNTTSITENIKVPELPLVVDSPVNDAIISGVKPIVSGTSKPGTNVTVTVSDGKQCTAVTDATNHWSCELPSLMFDQDYSLSIVSTDSIGNSVTKSIDVSTDKLPLSVITPQDNSTTEDTTPTFVGTSTPGTTIKVKVATGQECTAIADSDGKWSCELPVLPVGGPYLVTINAVDKEGNKASVTEYIKVPKIPLLILTPVAGEVITSNGVTVTGINDPDTIIKVLGPDGESCETTSDSTGEWSCQLDDLQSGLGKHITVISGEGTEGEKVSIRVIDIENSSDKVKTVLTGSSSLSLLFGLCFLLLLNLLRKKRQIFPH